MSKRNDDIAPATLRGLKSRVPYLRKVIRNHFPADLSARIVDLGCGHGALIYLAGKAGYCNIRGVDGSPEQVATAKILGIEGVEQGNVLEVIKKEKDATLDCLLAFDLIEHFNCNELIELVDEVYRVLRPGGSWIIHTPNAESPFGSRMRYWDITHEIAFTRTSLSQLLLSSGFHRVDCYEDQPVPHGIKSTVRSILWQIIRSFLRFYLAVETGDIGRKAVFSQNILAIALK